MFLNSEHVMLLTFAYYTVTINVQQDDARGVGRSRNEDDILYRRGSDLEFRCNKVVDF